MDNVCTKIAGPNSSASPDPVNAEDAFTKNEREPGSGTTSIETEVQNEDVTEALGRKLSKLDISSPQKGDDHSESSFSGSGPQTPASKGAGIDFRFDAESASRFLGPCYYFAAPVRWHHGYSEYGVFCLSPNPRTVSALDHQLVHHHYPVLDPPHEFVVQFKIGELIYQWYTLSNTLGFVLEPNAVRQLHPVPLSESLEAVKAMAQQLQEQSRHFNFVVTPDASITTAISHRPQPSRYNEGRFGVGPSVNSVSVAEDSSSLPTVSSRATTPPDSLNECFFGTNPKQEEIDNWVDQAAAGRRLAHEAGNMACPEMGCYTSSRRPHALKTHLYTHYNIRPVKCRVCGLHVLTEANLARHVKNAHVCPGCPDLGTFLDVKAHKATCLRVAKPPPGCKRKKSRTASR